jgi:hypothetical protein
MTPFHPSLASWRILGVPGDLLPWRFPSKVGTAPKGVDEAGDGERGRRTAGEEHVGELLSHIRAVGLNRGEHGAADGDAAGDDLGDALMVHENLRGDGSMCQAEEHSSERRKALWEGPLRLKEASRPLREGPLRLKEASRPLREGLLRMKEASRPLREGSLQLKKAWKVVRRGTLP